MEINKELFEQYLDLKKHRGDIQQEMNALREKSDSLEDNIQAVLHELWGDRPRSEEAHFILKTGDGDYICIMRCTGTNTAKNRQDYYIFTKMLPVIEIL